MTDVAAPSAKRIKEIFAADGKEVKSMYSQTISDKPMYRLPTDAEIAAGVKPDSYVLVSEEEAIL